MNLQQGRNETLRSYIERLQKKSFKSSIFGPEDDYDSFTVKNNDFFKRSLAKNASKTMSDLEIRAGNILKFRRV